MSIPQLQIYPEILERLKAGQKLLDVGCAVGQELRRLVCHKPWHQYNTVLISPRT